MLVPSYLEFSLDKLAKERGGFADVFGKSPLTSALMANPMADAARPIFAQIEEQTRQNVAMFRDALSMFTPGGVTPSRSDAPPPMRSSPEPSSPEPSSTELSSPEPREIDDMRRQLDEMRRRIESMAAKG